MKVFRFIVVADSHIRFPDDDVVTYPSNALMADRNRRVVELCNLLDAEFVVHLGDIVHPIPVEDAHEPAVELAASVYSDLEVPIHFVPGNHDVGDKPDAMVAVPAVADENYGVFERYWGSAFRSFDIGGCHLVILDTPVLNSNLDREAAQRAWLEDDLAIAAKAGLRIFFFTHYPPFVRDAAEDEHYDNLGEPARSWLLELLNRYKVEAVFSGHVHNFLYNHHEGTELYVLPSTGFVRPDYSELAAVAPDDEGGRNDPAKLGFFVVDVDEDGHTVRPIRTFGATELDRALPQATAAISTSGWECPVGVTLRHGWMSVVDFPTSGLDEFRRKTIRNDGLLPALWEARICDVRIPVGDLRSPEQVSRIRHLRDRGMRFTVRSAGVPDAGVIARVAGVKDLVHRWELVLWPEQFEAALRELDRVSLAARLAFAPVVSLGSEADSVHHFVTSGFAVRDDSGLSELLRLDSGRIVDELVFRVGPEDDMARSLLAVGGQVAVAGRRGVVNVELPRGGENVNFDDDETVADRVMEAVMAAKRSPDLAVFLDGFVDHDRSYYPRHALVDRRFNPRAALYRLIEAASG